eukprot:gb/GECG01007111.1/.p1 GENE.gb/GECG01007111.1/~~gb/GECG01007111.1/.p1  ORF type:complete len:670 (+),score=105.30 gb/GECG01007111.1/:1-2010(+)
MFGNTPFGGQPNTGGSGLFGNPSQTPNAPSGGGGGLFGSNAGPPSGGGGGLFGGGQPQQSGGLFGGGGGGGPFGGQQQQQQPPASSGFGGGLFGGGGGNNLQQPAGGGGGGLFGGNTNTPASSGFGAPSNTGGGGLFGSGGNTGGGSSLFGGGGSTLGGAPQGQQSLWGQPQQQQAGGLGGLGGSGGGGGGVFGQQPSAGGGGGGLFGSQQPQQGSGLFGNTQQPPSSTGGLFGGGQPQQPPGGGGLFGASGAQSQAGASGLFGGQPQNTNAGPFGQASSGFGTQPFGQQNPQSSFGGGGGGPFGGGTNQQSALFGGGGAPAAANTAPAAAAPDVLAPLPAGADTINCLSWSPSGQFLACASWDQKCYVFQVSNQGQSPQAQLVLDLNCEAPVLYIDWHADERSLFTATAEGVVKQWQLASKSPQAVAMHGAPVMYCQWLKQKGVLVTGSMDCTVKFWNLQSQQPVTTINLPDKVVAMDIRDPLMVVCMPRRAIHLFSLASNNPTEPFRRMESPLKLKARCCRVFPSCEGFAVASEEGRCAVRYAEHERDNRPKGGGFNFKCHRDGNSIYPVHSVDWQTNNNYPDILLTAGGDGTWNTWDKAKLGRASGSNKLPSPVTAARFNPTGDLFAYALGYDWSKGANGYNPQSQPTQVLLHKVVQKDLVVSKAN